jgi:hypothetical protein
VKLKLDKEKTNVGDAPLHGRRLDEDVCGILVYMKGQPGLVTIIEGLSSKPLVIETGPDKTGCEIMVIKPGQRASISHGATGRCIRRIK